MKITNVILFMLGAVSLLLEKLDLAITEAKASLKDQTPRPHKRLEEY